MNSLILILNLAHNFCVFMLNRKWFVLTKLPLHHNTPQKMTNTFFRFSVIGLLTQLLILSVNGQSRRPTISFISQPEIVTDIGGTVELKCSVQVIKLPPHNILKSNWNEQCILNVTHWICHCCGCFNNSKWLTLLC